MIEYCLYGHSNQHRLETFRQIVKHVANVKEGPPFSAEFINQLWGGPGQQQPYTPESNSEAFNYLKAWLLWLLKLVDGYNDKKLDPRAVRNLILTASAIRKDKVLLMILKDTLQN